MRTRWSAYAGVSAALAAGVIVKALAQRPNFYSAAVYLAQSSANLMILTNLIFVTACTLLVALQKILYGPLRPIEIEQLYEKAWFAVTETCLAMTIFRGEIGARFLIMFFALLAGKIWAWIGEGRVEILEQQPPRNPRLFHTRLALSLSLSVCFNLTMLEYVVKQVMHMPKPDMMVMFGFEFAVLSIVSLSIASRYAINLAEIAIVRQQKGRRIEEIRRERIQSAVRGVDRAPQQDGENSNFDNTTPSTSSGSALSPQAVEAARRAAEEPIDEQEIEVEGWDGKGRWTFYLDLATDFFKLVVYLSFFFILLIFYGLPIHILRDVFMTFRSFIKRIGDFVRYRTATRDMNARYPDATEQEIGSEDVCIICREEMQPYRAPADGERANPVMERMRPKKLPCGHILHFSCLRSWLERQQICPTCRTNVVTRTNGRGRSGAPAADGQAGQHGHAPPAERPAARVYQLGPLRIGLGAGRGNNMLEDLQQQLGDGPPRQPQPANADDPQQYGFGIRWDGLRRGGRNERGQRSIQRQLDDVQRQINQEYRGLGQLTQELRLLRNMEAELGRLRSQRQGSGTATQVPPPPAGPRQPASNVLALTGDYQRTIPAGSDRLPAGVTLPDGWSMMPLNMAQPFDGQPRPNLFQPPAFPMPAPGPPGFPNFPLNQGNVNEGIFNNLLHNGQNIQPSNGVNQPTAINPQQSTTVTSQQGPTTTNVQDPNQTNSVRDTLPLDGQPENESSVPRLHVGSRPGTEYQSPASATSVTAEPSAAAMIREPIPNVTVHREPGAARQPLQNGSNETPVESMFTLPSWGNGLSESVDGAANSEGSPEGAREEPPNGSITADTEGVDESGSESSSKPAGNNKNATVEDPVDEPD